MRKLTILKPDDWHLHVRSGGELQSVIGMSSAQMGRAIIMPNLSPPITSVEQALIYREEILGALPNGHTFEPLMVLYLTDNTSVKEIELAANNEFIKAAKLYPSGATTNSDKGVTDVSKIYPVLESMQKNGMPLLVHGEITHKEVDIFDREAAFIDQVLEKTIKNFPSLKVVFEHITTKDAKDFVLSCKDNVAATITPHHLLANRNNMLVGGIQPHYYCLPVLKREDPHQLALLDAATSGNPKFFLGTDSAPHPKESKESSCGCAGILNSHCAIELYATAFESKDALDKLEGFASKFGPDFYSLPRNKETITITKQQWKVPNSYVLGNSTVVPFMAGENISWKMD
ncbi:MAG TPA: dihydroorotase [Gammaproteobacteria bacterium]|nr:dihydroorotase [Gammaproteobacteria bacterium]|tara:strand:+ start:317 stop:1351 length:1035 start_codon:yes stop_codon:yes gene_type:complete